MSKKPTKPKPDTSALKGLFIISLMTAFFCSALGVAYGPPQWFGLIGVTMGKMVHAILGLGCYATFLFVGWIGWRKLFHKSLNHLILKSFFFFLFLSSFCVLLSLIEDQLPHLGKVLGNLFYPYLWAKKQRYHLGGSLFYYLYHDVPSINLLNILSVRGVALFSSTALFASVLFLTKTTPLQCFKAIYRAGKWFFQLFATPKAKEQQELPEEMDPQNPSRYVALRIPDSPQKEGSLEIQPEANPTVRPSMSQKKSRTKEEVEEHKPISKREAALAAQRVHNGDFEGYSLPSPSLLTNAKKVDQSSLKQDLKRQAEVLEETLLSFGIEAKVGQINCGPSITSFEVHPSIGVKVQKIKALESDIALNMEAKSIRIIAPIPGKAAVGIEVPNPNPQEVGFKEMLLAYQQSSRKFNLPVLLGKTVSGEYVMSDLAKMPHCIIAGATGSGKSVCINTIVMTLLMTSKPDQVKLIMVDPKKVELTPYTQLPHMLAPVITEPQGACAALNWLVKEMENRYDLLKQLGARNIEAFNTRKVNKTFEAALEKPIPDRLPYIVVIIDELADLMMVASSDIETPIARIAQMARAVGIHLILATQRPSREVITGIIKANFPTRIAFKVASRVNSQIILDEVGAEALLGNGDMLFLPPGTSIPMRAQGAFIRDEDIAAVVKKICAQAPPNYAIASFDALGKEESTLQTAQESSNDKLYDQALEIVLSSGNASTTFLQRKLKIGYARAASLMDELEAQGVIGQTDGSKTRKILGAKEEEVKEPQNE